MYYEKTTYRCALNSQCFSFFNYVDLVKSLNCWNRAILVLTKSAFSITNFVAVINLLVYISHNIINNFINTDFKYSTNVSYTL